MNTSTIQPNWQLGKYPVIFITSTIGWKILEAADVFIARYQLPDNTFMWLSGFVLLAFVFTIATTVMKKRNVIRILLVDDHAMIRNGLKNLLEMRSGYNVVAETANGFEAINLIKQSKFDIVFTDINMPVMDGMQLCKMIKEHDDDVKVIAYSMHNDSLTVNKMLEAGASSYLLKSCNSDELYKAIENVMQGIPYLSSNLSVAGFDQP